MNERNLLERQPTRSLRPCAVLLPVFALTVAGIALTRGGWWVLFWAIPAALLSGQLGFLAHDATHNQVFRTGRANYVLGLVLFNLFLGGSRGWWADKHNAHHAQPNLPGVDPDIEGGVVAVTGEQAREASGFTRFMVRHQAATIAPLLCLSVLQIRAYSARFLRAASLRHARAEAGLFAAHYAIYFGVLVLCCGLGRALVFSAVHQLLLGLYLGGAFLPNHIGMAVLAPGEPVEFLRRQVITSRNIRGGRVTDFMFGALSCQVEHHLFPTMPRHRLRDAAAIVRRFCDEHGVPYRETSVWGAYVEVFQHLRAMARTASQRDLGLAGAE